MNAYASPWADTPTLQARNKRAHARAALWRRFEREVRGLGWDESMRLRQAYQMELDEIEKDYQRAMWMGLHRIMAR